MPNIEIHGLEFKKACEIRDLIDQIMEEIHLAKYSITTIISSETRTCAIHGEKKVPMPFLRLWTGKKDHKPERLEMIANALFRGLCKEFDIEYAYLEGFIERPNFPEV